MHLKTHGPPCRFSRTRRLLRGFGGPGPGTGRPALYHGLHAVAAGDALPAALALLLRLRRAARGKTRLRTRA